MKVLVVGNPTAQSGAARAHIDRALAFLVGRGVEAELVATEPEGRTVAAVSRAIDELAPDVVVSLGGDGTFNEVARGILGASRKPRMGMLPMGTANDQGRSFGVHPGPAHIEDNLDVVLRGHVLQLDVGHVEALDEGGGVLARAHFFDSAGWGMHPDILAARNRDRRDVEQVPILREIYRDQAVYAGAAIERFLTSFFEPTKLDAVVGIDGVEHRFEDLTDLIINGTPVYAGEWVLDRRSAPDDGRFELIPIRGRRDWAMKAVRDLAVLPLDEEDLELVGVAEVERFSGSQFDIFLSRPGADGTTAVPSQIDGEEWVASAGCRVTVLANLLPLIVPEGWVPPWR